MCVRRRRATVVRRRSVDLGLPHLAGQDFCRAYRERGGRAPIVLVTGADPKIVQTAMEACGAAAYVRKPFDIETLLDTLERLVRP